MFRDACAAAGVPLHAESAGDHVRAYRDARIQDVPARLPLRTRP